MKNKKRLWWRIAVIVLASMVIAVVALAMEVRRHIPAELLPDIRAGLAARKIADPDARLGKFLELRYGPMSNPANRQKVFMDFFNIDHIKALQLMVKHSPPSQRQASIRAMARWIENYRQSLTPAESAALKTHFESPEGQASLKRATTQYNSQDVQYRGQTAIVISQLLQTIAAVRKQ